MAAFGLPFFAAGIFVILSVSGVIPVSNAGDMPRWGWFAMAAMGLVFTGVGGTLVFGRAWTTLDVTRRLVIKQWDLLIPLRERTYLLTGYSAVTLGFVRGDSDTADRFPVGLKAQHGSNLPLCSFTTYADSRACAIAVARHLHQEIEDSTSDHRVRVTPADAERSIRERAAELTHEAAVPRPANARSTVSREPDGTRIEIPYPRVHSIVAAAGLVPLIPMIVVPWRDCRARLDARNRDSGAQGMADTIERRQSRPPTSSIWTTARATRRPTRREWPRKGKRWNQPAWIRWR